MTCKNQVLFWQGIRHQKFTTDLGLLYAFKVEEGAYIIESFQLIII